LSPTIHYRFLEEPIFPTWPPVPPEAAGEVLRVSLFHIFPKMKNRLPLVFLALLSGLIWFYPLNLSAQNADTRALNNGAILPQVVFLDLQNRYHAIEDALDSGKTVVLDLFWAKCEPCWEYYQSGKLQTIQNELGPNGTNQVTVYSIETEGASVSCLMGMGSCTYGNFLANANYCVASDASAVSLAFEIVGYPDYWVVMPDRYMYKLGSVTANSVRTLMQTHPNKYLYWEDNVQLMSLNTGLPASCLCPGDSIRPELEVRNFGRNIVSSIEFQVFSDTNYLHTYTWTGELAVQETRTITLPPFIFPTNTKLYITASKVNGEDDPDDNNNTLKRFIRLPLTLKGSGYVIRSLLKADADRWYWEFMDHEGNILDYGGNPLVGSNGGGTFNANNPVPFHPDAYEDGIQKRDTIKPAKPGCHRLKIVDGLRKGIHFKIDSSYFRLYNFPADNQGYNGVESMFKEYDVVFEVKPELIDGDQDGYSFDEDCDDSQSAVYPNAPEIPGNGIDEDCNGQDSITVIPCIAHAGRDTAFCTFYGLDTIFMGGTPVVSGGVPPFSYSWSTDYEYANLHYTASDFLSDTSASNPQLIDINPVGDELVFRLDVTDSLGNTSYDSVTIQFSKWTITLDAKQAYIQEGDSVQLYISVYGGLSPVSYHWTPEIGLQDPSDPYTWASPTETTQYQLEITDSIGCQLVDDFLVYVAPTLTNEPGNDFYKVEITPHPVVNESVIKINSSEVKDFHLVLFNLLGTPLLTSKFQDNQFLLKKSELTPGIYFYQVILRDQIVAIGKVIVD
jgi:hypothetical protein